MAAPSERSTYDVSRADARRAPRGLGPPRLPVDQVWDGPLPAARPLRRADRPARRRCAPGWPRRCPPALEPVVERTADGGDTVKWLWRLARRRHASRPCSCATRDRATVCVSSQAGCAMACGFCATGQAGFERHLTAGEIVEQVVRARAAARRRRPAARPTSCSWAWASRWPTTTPPGRRSSRLHDDLGISRPPPHRVDGRHRPRHPAARRRGAAGEPRRVAARRQRRAARRARADQPALPARRPAGGVRATYLDGQGPAALVRVGADRRRQRPRRRRRPSSAALRPAAARAPT